MGNNPNDIIKRLYEEQSLEFNNILENGGFIRKRYNFSQVSNYILDDENIPIETRGLYVIIQRWIDKDGNLPTKEFLRNKCNVGEAKFDRMWCELKRLGCLKQIRLSLGKNRFKYKYILNFVAKHSDEVAETYNKNLTKIIKKKYNYTCQRCGEIEKDKPFHVHHIVPRKTQKLVNDENNLILLCSQCHKWVHSELNVNREYII